jgi:phosphoribosylformylglycinamidine synthase
VHLREEGMTPREVMVSESQERMVFEVEPSDANGIIDIAAKYDLLASVIGEVIAEPVYRVKWNGETVADIPVDALCTSPPMYEREVGEIPQVLEAPPEEPPSLKQALLSVLSSPNVASKSWVYTQYDHTVGIRTISPMGQDAAILRMLGPDSEPIPCGAVALSCGVNPRHVFIEPRNGTYGAVLENAANLACAGARPFAVVDCLNFGDPDDPRVFAEFAGAVDGISAACRDLDVPVVGGNVSFYNESEEHGTAVKPTPSIGMLGWIDEPGNAPPLMFPADGEEVFLLGNPAQSGLGGSEFYALHGGQGSLPPLPPDATSAIGNIREMVSAGLFSSCHDVSLGGMAASLAEMARGRGAEIDITTVGGDPLVSLFSEAHCRWLVSVPTDKIDEFKRTCSLNSVALGKTGYDGLKIRAANETVRLSTEEINEALDSLTLLMRAGAR